MEDFTNRLPLSAIISMARAILLALAEKERLAHRSRLERRLLREESRPLLLPEKQFMGLYRLSKRQFLRLCEEIIPLLPTQLRSHERNTAIKPGVKILAAIAFYAHGSYQKKLGAMYHLGLGQTSVSHCIKDVTEALNNPSILGKYKKFPHTADEREVVALGFMNNFGFPGVLGCIDGTHVAIIRPTQWKEDYFNRKAYHFLNVMVFYYSGLIIRQVDASFGGAAHDSHIWNCSPLKRLMERLHEEMESFWLLGDSGYAQRPRMMQPILHAEPNSPEEHYTTKHCRTRNVVERCFGVPETRWRCLVAHCVLHYLPVKAGMITNACVVLHNFIKDASITIDREELKEDRARQPPGVPFDGPENIDYADRGRSAVVNRLWLNRPVRHRLHEVGN